MRSTLLAIIGLLGASIIVGGCGLIQLTPADDGSELTLTAGGETFTISLPSNATTGYQWELAELDQAIVENTDQRYVPDPVPFGVVGSGGTEIWEFAARAPGTTTLRLEYRRSFEPEAEAADTFGITVTVNPSR